MSVFCRTSMCTSKVDLVGVAQLHRGNVEFLVCDRRKKGNHIKMAVMADWSHFLRKTVIFWEATQPFFKYGISEGMQHLKEIKDAHLCHHCSSVWVLSKKHIQLYPN